jgi:hypothetical protein
VAREPELNSLDRYVKSSPRFVLEEHGHCEIPAGCGGVVLRWRDRFTAIPVETAFAVVGAEDWRLRIADAAPSTVRPLLAPGRHVLMVVVHGVVEGEFAFLAWVTSPDTGEAPLLWTPGSDDAWRVTGRQPETAAWIDPDFDVSTWVRAVPGQVDETAQAPYSVRRALSLGARPLTVEPSVVDDVAPRVWLRAVFELPEAR